MGGAVSGASGSTQQDADRWRIAEQERSSAAAASASARAASAAATSSTTRPATALKIGGIYVPPFSPDTIARMNEPAVLGNLGLYDLEGLDREITATRARLAKSSGPSRAADELNLRALEEERAKRPAARKKPDATLPPLLADLSAYSVDRLEQEIKAANARVAAKPGDASEGAGLDALQKELAKRLTPEPVDVDFLTNDAQVVDALKKEVTFLSRFSTVVPSEVRLRHAATLKTLEQKHDAMYGEAHACDHAKVPTAKFSASANGSYELQFTADDLVNALKQRVPMTPKEEAAVRKEFESWRSSQCMATGVDPTRIRNEDALHLEKDTTALQREEMQKRAEILEASAGSVCAALAFVDSAMRGDSVDAAYTRVMGARALSDVAMTTVHGPQAHFDTTQKTEAPQARPAAPSTVVQAKPSAPAANTAPAEPPATTEGSKPAAPGTPGPAPRPVSASPNAAPAAAPGVAPATAPAPGVAGTSAVGRVEPFSSPNGTFKTKPMNKMFEGEDVPGNRAWESGSAVEYRRTNAERAEFKLEVRKVTENGKTEFRIYGADGKPFDTRSARTANNQTGKAIFVMNADGELFASNHQEAGAFHHSSLAGGQAVAAAGELVVEDGKLIAVTNQSGHYWPEAFFTNQALASLQNRGINLSGVKVTDVRTGAERIFQ